MSKSEVMLCCPCCWISNANSSFPLLISPHGYETQHWDSLIWKVYLVSIQKAEEKITEQNVLWEHIPVLPLVPWAALLLWPVRMRPAESLALVPTPVHFWTATALEISHSAPSFATKTKGSGPSQPHTWHPCTEGKEEAHRGVSHGTSFRQVLPWLVISLVYSLATSMQMPSSHFSPLSDIALKSCTQVRTSLKPNI